MIFAGTFMDVFLGGSMNNRNQYQIIIFGSFSSPYIILVGNGRGCSLFEKVQ